MKELAKAILEKHQRLAELRSWLTVNDMAGLERAQSVEAERLTLEIAAEGVLLAKEVEKLI